MSIFPYCFVCCVIFFFQNVPAGAAPSQWEGGVDWPNGAAVHGGDQVLPGLALPCLTLPCLALPCLALSCHGLRVVAG